MTTIDNEAGVHRCACKGCACPSWCDGTHVTDEDVTDPGYHHGPLHDGGAWSWFTDVQLTRSTRDGHEVLVWVDGDCEITLRVDQSTATRLQVLSNVLAGAAKELQRLQESGEV